MNINIELMILAKQQADEASEELYLEMIQSQLEEARAMEYASRCYDNDAEFYGE